MSLAENNTAFKQLYDINQIYTSIKAIPPKQNKIKSLNELTEVMGIGFRLGTFYFIININELEEIITETTLTPIPLVKSWVKGVSNMRGHLLSVIDLDELFGIQPDTTRKQQRVIAIKNPIDNGYIGFIVDAVFGIQQYPLTVTSPDKIILSTIPPLLQPFITAYYPKKYDWLIFDIKAFVTSQLFLTV